MSLIVVIVATLMFVSGIHGYPTGAPQLACQDMVPGHPATNTTGSPPFMISLDRTKYMPGDTITGTISSPGKVVFRGFLIQARSADDMMTPIGEFLVTSNETHTVCGTGAKQGLTHSNNTDRTEVKFLWKAPSSGMGNVQFNLTVVESFQPSRYWLKILSSVVEDESDNSSTSEPAAMTTNIPPTATPPNTGGIVNDPDCGTKKGCFSDCKSTGCSFLVTWQQNNKNNNGMDNIGSVDFDIKMVLSSSDDVWVGIGLSTTGKMDGTNVAACLVESGGVTLQSSYNDGYSNTLFQDTTLGLSNMAGSVSNGVLHCAFTRVTSLNHTHFHDLHQKFYLLVGTGPVSSGAIQQHINIPTSSSSKINFLSNKVAKEDTPATALVKLHAGMMIAAWVFFSSVGVVAARHCKEMMPATLWCQARVWFQLHRSYMIAAVLCIVTAVVAIFYENGGFRTITAPSGKEFTRAHPYLGIVVTVLALINPIMGLLRPSTDSKNRYIFNWAHFFVGTTAHILAVITIFIGLQLDKAKVKDTYAIYIMIVYVVIFVLVQSVLEMYNRARKARKTYGTLENVDDVQNKKDKTGDNVTSYTLFLHATGMIVISVLLVVIICKPADFLSS